MGAYGPCPRCGGPMHTETGDLAVCDDKECSYWESPG